MDGGMLVLIISAAALAGGAIGWLGRQYWYRREARRQAAHDASESLKEKKALLEDKIAKTKDSGLKNRLVSQRDEVDQMLFALQSEILGHALKDANLSNEENLIADGRSHLKPQEVTSLKKDAEKVGAMSSLTIRDCFALARAYYDTHQYQDAKRINDIILILNPDDPDALNNRGVIYAHLDEEV